MGEVCFMVIPAMTKIIQFDLFMTDRFLAQVLVHKNQLDSPVIQ